MLALSVISSQSQSLGANSYRLFDANGGVIGRNEDSQMVLPDDTRTVSGQHARIRCQNGSYYVIDLSTNGTFLNSPDRRLPKGQPVELNDGDRLIIGDYEVVAQIVPMAAQPKPAPAARNPWEPGGFGQAPAPAPFPTPEPTPPPLMEEPVQDFLRGDTLDPIAIMGGARREFGDLAGARQGGEMSPQLAGGGSVLQQHYAPPQSQPVQEEKDTGPLNPYDITGYSRDYARPMPPPRPAPPPVDAGPIGRGMQGMQGGPGMQRNTAQPIPPVQRVPPSAMVPPVQQPSPLLQRAPPHQVGMSDAVGILEGLGLNPAQVPPEITQQLGEILRVVIQGTVDVLQARAQVKNQFRLDQTMLRVSENNPLKLSANADHALQNLFLTSNPAFLRPVDAFEDAFRDLRYHQLAMLAGIRAAFDAMLKKFDPAALEALFERKGKRSGLLGVGGRGRYWELYRERFADMTEDAEANFQRLFGEEFARAYTEQLRRLASASPGAGR